MADGGGSSVIVRKDPQKSADSESVMPVKLMESKSKHKIGI